ncbi:hypothetical protein FB554_2928 [Barrientosiimonas humi]|uniref:Uncharacterized protein n=1 Tax=Barrientosiimonas humi TaxID=999931 RepID=A0A542XFZ9_9MICO|nr:hypothetical protein [Barrientosiimonas humi]TQL34749.1 hypothetical protein FB554_2928 [Barrientosiimonas humi]CAG7570811.1 hypothetical protein BH39T_PBIAJDOK_00047 [Barrientosiimonas humi]
MTTWELTALDGGHPSGFLAALGLAALSDGTLSFLESGTPALTHEKEAGDVARSVVDQLENLTAPENFPLPDVATLRSTTPAWSALADLCAQSWDSPALDDVLRTMDVGGTKGGAVIPADPQVKSAALILISGRSYVRKSCADLWPPAKRGKDSAQHRAQQRQLLLDDVHALLDGDAPRFITDSMVLRFSVAETSPRLTLGTESAAAVPVVELLALVGVLQLLPGTLDAEGGAGLVWSLNPAPMGASAVAQLVINDIHPASWPTFTASVRSIGGGTKASRFDSIRRVSSS